MIIFFTKILFHYKMQNFMKILYYENLEPYGKLKIWLPIIFCMIWSLVKQKVKFDRRL